VQALDAACWAARDWLRRPGLTEGAVADLVGYPADPRAEPEVLRTPGAVVLRGAVVHEGRTPGGGDR
jgi:imidazolonepropionase-like amidohydrolase